jgi:hypothetical protein
VQSVWVVGTGAPKGGAGSGGAGGVVAEVVEGAVEVVQSPVGGVTLDGEDPGLFKDPWKSVAKEAMLSVHCALSVGDWGW